MTVNVADPVENFDEKRLSQTDPVARMVEKTYLIGTDFINAVNEVLLNQETGTPVREIDKALKAEADKVSKGENSDLDKNTVKAWADAQKAYETYRAKVDEARNAYRKNVLGEEEKATAEVSDEDKERARDYRKAVNDAVSFLTTIASANKQTDLVEWAKSLEIPQVGRQGSSSVGTKKPRVFVFIDDSETPEDSLTNAAKKISTKDQKVTASDLAAAWDSAIGDTEGSFQAFGHTLRVQAKPKKSDG
jgi:hypothetical protein